LLTFCIKTKSKAGLASLRKVGQLPNKKNLVNDFLRFD